MDKSSKIISKYYRISMTDKIRLLLQSLPVRNVIESQVGNHIYSGDGEILVGSHHYPVSIKIRVEHKYPVVIISSPKTGLLVKCEFNVDTVKSFLEQETNKLMN